MGYYNLHRTMARIIGLKSRSEKTIIVYLFRCTRDERQGGFDDQSQLTT